MSDKNRTREGEREGGRSYSDELTSSKKKREPGKVKDHKIICAFLQL